MNDLREHEDECRTAKAATEAGRRELEREDHEPHAQDDADAREFKHGTRRAS
ncbi:MAG: hypothetical protein HYS04_22250 [Acidobacteria bacterium]|nr:hypothetical protein [Acidobacteriota bacterium]